MCSRGIYQLERFRLHFCDFGKSSNGVRELLKSQELTQFLDKNPQIKLDLIVQRGKHPCVYGQYINGYEKSISLRNNDLNENMRVLVKLRTQCGHVAYSHSHRKVITTRPSIQGVWTPLLWRKEEEVHEIEYLRKFPDHPVPHYEEIQKPFWKHNKSPHTLLKMQRKKVPSDMSHINKKKPESPVKI